MTVEEMLDAMDNEDLVFIRIRPYGRPGNDIVVGATDWHEGGIDHAFVPKGLKEYLGWKVEDVCAETYEVTFPYTRPHRIFPEPGRANVPMVVVSAYKAKGAGES
jgi:hypothetical protein